MRATLKLVREARRLSASGANGPTIAARLNERIRELSADPDAAEFLRAEVNRAELDRAELKVDETTVRRWMNSDSLLKRLEKEAQLTPLKRAELLKRRAYFRELMRQRKHKRAKKVR